ncbi:hypothetical protein ElyMa_006796300 [Elysia marginata]|uniref:Uncharacterized protein n=1 Tax=Elysia marginata TaxID=1093978 RepID=A0AAV4J3I4_9GAST|nr:hypothetical protein ElyMa_006796300 [Elysia marginata]
MTFRAPSSSFITKGQVMISSVAEVKKPTEGSTMKVTDNLQSEVKDGMLQLASGKSVPVMMNCAALSDPEKTRSLRLPILRGEIGGPDARHWLRKCRG